jgi:hypothetical protein
MAAKQRDPIVAASAAFFDDVQRLHAKPVVGREGSSFPHPNFITKTHRHRYTCDAAGSVCILASLRRLDWIFNFHDKLIKAVRVAGGDVTILKDGARAQAAVTLDGHAVHYSYAEGVERVLLPAKPGAPANYDDRPSLRGKLKLQRRCREEKTWDASEAALDDDVEGFARKLLAAVSEDRSFQEKRNADEAVRLERARLRSIASNAWFAEQELINAKRKAAKAQLARLVKAGEEKVRHDAMVRLVDAFEARIPAGSSGDGLRIWLSVARAGHGDPLDALFNELTAELAADQRPDWWPQTNGESNAT